MFKFPARVIVSEYYIFFLLKRVFRFRGTVTEDGHLIFFFFVLLLLHF